MDLLHHLEEFASNISGYEEEPTSEDVTRWHTLFGYSDDEAHNAIEALRANLDRKIVSEDQWNMIKGSKEADGHSRETWEHQLQLWTTSRRSRKAVHTRSNDTAVYVFQLKGPFDSITALERLTGVKAEARSGENDDGNSADFARITGAQKRTIENWLSLASIAHRPMYIRLSQSPKELSPHSAYPTLGIDSILPLHRASSPEHSFAPAQTEYPVWYFFYGTLMVPEVLQKCISLPQPPIMVPAAIKGGRLRSWGRKYKALVDASAESEVRGFAYYVQSVEQEECLRFRETEAYEVVRTRILFSHGGVLEEAVSGLTFRFRKVEELDVD